MGDGSDVRGNGTITAAALTIWAGVLVAFWGTHGMLPSGAVVAELPPRTTRILDPKLQGAGFQDALRPYQTDRGIRAWANRGRWVHRHELALRTRKRNRLTISLTGPLQRPKALWRRPDVNLPSMLPHLDEVPFSAGPLANAWGQARTAWNAHEDVNQKTASFAFAAQKAGLDVQDPALINDPWRALMAMEAERIRALNAARNGAADGQQILALADALVTSHQHEPIADYARLYRLQLLGDQAWNTSDSHNATLAAAEALGNSPDRIVRAMALYIVERDDDLAEQLLPLLDKLWNRGQNTVWVASVGADHAVSIGNPDVARVWLSRLEETVKEDCRVNDEPEDCHSWNEEILWGQAQLNAIEGLDTFTANEHLRASAWRCHIWRDPLIDSEVKGKAVFEGNAWTWKNWRRHGHTADAFSACLELQSLIGPGFRDPIYVEIHSD